MPEWAWRVPVGRPRWDRSDPDGPWLTNSLASRLHDLEQWAMSRTHDHGRKLAQIPVDEETPRRVQPEFVAEWEEIRAAPE